jgi:hypothetical protein
LNPPPDDELFAVSPEDAGPGVPPELRPGAQSLEDAAAGEGGEAAPAGGLKRRVIPDPPEIDQSRGWGTAAFLLVLALAAAVITIAVGALNTYADPYGLIGTRALPTLTTSDRSIKVDYIDKLKKPPQLIVLGSSRSMRYDPPFFQKKTGLDTFNAGVNGIGGIPDAWAMANYIHSRFPDSRPAYFWLVDVESFVPFSVQGNTAAEPRLNQYLGGPPTGRRSPSVVLRAVWANRTSVFSWTTAADSLRVLRHPAAVKRAVVRYRSTFLPDGGLGPHPYSPAEFRWRYPNSVTRYQKLYRTTYRGMDPQAQRYFERTLAFMNANGATPVIVLTPINPKVLPTIGPLGWYQRHRQVVDFIQSLHARYRFKFVDLTDIRTFRGDPVQFFDAVHMTAVNTDRAIAYVLKRIGGMPK